MSCLLTGAPAWRPGERRCYTGSPGFGTCGCPCSKSSNGTQDVQNVSAIEPGTCGVPLDDSSLPMTYGNGLFVYDTQLGRFVSCKAPPFCCASAGFLANTVPCRAVSFRFAGDGDGVGPARSRAAAGRAGLRALPVQRGQPDGDGLAGGRPGGGEATVLSFKGSDHCLSFCFSAFPCGSTALTADRCSQVVGGEINTRQIGQTLYQHDSQSAVVGEVTVLLAG
eukprot:SAG22_NODE_48_length_24654_cov_4.406394_14_plen_223_part_00